MFKEKNQSTMENETKQSENKSENTNEPVMDNEVTLSDEDVKAIVTEMSQKYADTLTDILNIMLPGHKINSVILSVSVDEHQFMRYVGNPQTLAANLCAILEDDSIEFPRHLAIMAMASKRCQKFFDNKE